MKTFQPIIKWTKMVKSKRIGNLEFRRATYLLPEDKLPKHMSYHIDYWYPNPYYKHEDDYDTLTNIHKECFKNPESCFAIASFGYDTNEHVYELRFIGDRPLDITKEEREAFWELIRYGYGELNKGTENTER